MTTPHYALKMLSTVHCTGFRVQSACGLLLYSILRPPAAAELINRRGEGREKKKNSKEFNFLKNILAQKRKNFKKKIDRCFILKNKISKFC